jgi:hypothetical protein
MYIPKEVGEKVQFLTDIIRKCNASRESRRDFYRLMRSYYLFGTNDLNVISGEGRFNNIMPHIEQLSAFMFSPESTRFSIDLGPTVNAEEYYKVTPMSKGLMTEWHGQNEGGLDTDFKNALDWSSVYGSMFIKFRWKSWKRSDEDGQITEGGEIQHFIVEPHNLGVLREDKRGLYKQEAICETYYITRTQLDNELRASFHPNRVDIISRAQAGAHGSESMSSAGTVDRLIVTSLQGGSITGNAAMRISPLSMMYRPTVVEDLIEMNELYIYDDSIDDWRIITLMNQGEIWPIWDRPIGKMFVPRTLPYIQICPRPHHDYFFGRSEVECLVPLQDMLNERIDDVRHMLKMQAHPSSSVTGETAIPDEMQMALDTPSGILALASPATQIKVNNVTIPQDIWSDVRQIKDFFGEVSGLPPVNQGQGVKGVRSEGHANLLSQLGATRPKNRSLIVEESLDDSANLIVKIKKRYDKRPYCEDKEGGKQFFAHQFPDDFAAKVDGHSSSPVFMENYEQKVFNLLDRAAITKEMAVMLLDLPMKELIKLQLITKIEPAEAAAHEEERDLKLASIEGKRQK